MRRIAFLAVALQFLVACGGGGGGGGGSSTPPPDLGTAPAITANPASTTVTAGQTASFSVTASGTSPLAYQWQKNGSTISGATSANYTTAATTLADNGATFSVKVSNAAGNATSSGAVLTVNAVPPPPLLITTAALPNGVATAVYNATLAATGGTPPYSWSAVSGALPAGLSLAAATGVISGTPTSAGTAAFGVRVRDASTTTANAALSITIDPAPPVVPFRHVVIVVEENTNYANVVGNTAKMPYLNSLMDTYGLATQYYANTHPSIGNYFMLTTGQILTNTDSKTPSSFPVSADNVVRQLIANGKTWKSYAEDLPSVGYVGGNISGYAVRHNPLAYFTDVQNSASARQNLVPFTQFATDLAAGRLPAYSFVVPNLCNDGHDCGLDVADMWLQTNIDPLLTSTPFKDDGLLIIVFDEADSTDTTRGGGRIVAVLASPKYSKAGFRSTTVYQHESLLRLTLEGLGVTSLPGAAAAAPKMWEFFTFPPPT
jgi:acid phosphatase